METVLHETGHSILDATDKKISKRIGKSSDVETLDELKAETVGIKILLETAQRGELPAEVDLKSQLLAKLGTNLDYLKNKSSQKASAGEPYFLCGSTIIGSLLAKNLITKNDSGYEISDSEACLQEISTIGDKVLSFYTSSETKPVDIKKYINELRAGVKGELLQNLMNEF